MQNGKVKTLRLQTMRHMTQKLQIARVERAQLGKKTADQAPRTWRKPEILVGGDYFFDFMTEAGRLKIGLYMVDTILGPILTGLSKIREAKG